MNKSHILVTASTIALTALVIAELGISTVAFAGGPISGPITAPISGPVGTPTPTPTATPVMTPTPTPVATATPKPTHSPKPTHTPRSTPRPTPAPTPKPRHDDDDRGHKFGQVIQRWVQECRNWLSRFSHR